MQYPAIASHRTVQIFRSHLKHNGTGYLHPAQHPTDAYNTIKYWIKLHDQVYSNHGKGTNIPLIGEYKPKTRYICANKFLASPKKIHYCHCDIIWLLCLCKKSMSMTVPGVKYPFINQGLAIRKYPAMYP